MYTIEKFIKCTLRWQFCFSSSINSFKVMNKNVPKNGKNITISVKFHETVKLIVKQDSGQLAVDWTFFYWILSSFTCRDFYAAGLKGPPGASSNWILRLSVRLFVRNSIPLLNKVQYFKFRWWYSSHTWTVSPSMGCSHFTDIPCPWVGLGQNVGLTDFCHIF